MKLGKQIYTVEDRMNARYTAEDRRVDIWMQKQDMALAFGTRALELQVVSLPN